MRTFILLAALAALVCAGCQSAARHPASATYNVRSDGMVSPTVRAAMDPTPGPGMQELFGLKIPFGPFTGTVGILWDGTTFSPTVPIGPFAAQADPCAPSVQSTPCAPQVQMVPRTETRTVLVPHVVVPVPQAAAGPCD